MSFCFCINSFGNLGGSTGFLLVLNYSPMSMGNPRFLLGGQSCCGLDRTSLHTHFSAVCMLKDHGGSQ